MIKPNFLIIADLQSKLTRSLAGLSLVAISNFASAKINIKNGAYEHSHVEVPSLELVRSYSSRSHFTGLFGFGWCSNIESKIEQNVDGTYVVSECGRRLTDNSLRVTFGKGRIPESFVFMGRKYDGLGRLQSYFLSGGGSVSLIYNDSGKLVHLLGPREMKVTLHYEAERERLRSLHVKEAVHHKYQYLENKLTKWIVHRRHFGSYEYDILGNLTQRSVSGQWQERIRYNMASDLAVGFASRATHCSLRLEYHWQGSHQSRDSVVEKWCSGKLVQRKSYRFLVGQLDSVDLGGVKRIRVTFDVHHRLTKLSEGNKDLTLRYRLGERKPSQLAHPQLGSVWFVYDSLGELVSVYSKNKKEVKETLLDMFLGYLEEVDTIQR